MSTRTDEKRYLTELTLALRARNISGVRIGEIIAEVEMHTADSGLDPRESFGAPKEYASQFEPTMIERKRVRWGRQSWAGILCAAIGGWFLASGAFAGMTGEQVIGLPGWWVCAIGAAILLITFSLLPIDAIIDPRRPNARRYAKSWLLGWVAGAIVVVVLLIVGLMSLIG